MTEKKFSSLQAVAGPVSRETFERLEFFEAAFRRWAGQINLVAPSTLPNLWERHILDSAQLLPLAPEAVRWLDIGSGGGFPGAIEAILLAERLGARADLVESSRKKAAFLQTTLATLKAPATIHANRIEDCFDSIATPDVVTARALAPLPRLFSLAAPWLERGATGLFHKGRDYLREVEESRDVWDFDLVEHPTKVGNDGVILAVKGLHRR